MRRQSGDVTSVEQDAPALRRIEAGDDIGEGGLATSVRADETEDFAALDPHVDAVERHDAAKASLDGLALQYRTGALTSKRQIASSARWSSWLSVLKAGQFFLSIIVRS
jgi:hypothetical protein